MCGMTETATTTPEWFEDFDREKTVAALDNASLLLDAFVWQYTPEGHDYWEDVRDGLGNRPIHGGPKEVIKAMIYEYDRENRPAEDEDEGAPITFTLTPEEATDMVFALSALEEFDDMFKAPYTTVLNQLTADNSAQLTTYAAISALLGRAIPEVPESVEIALPRDLFEITYGAMSALEEHDDRFSPLWRAMPIVEGDFGVVDSSYNRVQGLIRKAREAA